MPRDYSDDEQRRFDAEEERNYWESIEDQQRAEEEERAVAKEAALEAMERWFFKQFEDPQNETLRDTEDQSFIYPWGGPFEAADVLHGAFAGDYAEEWIREAVERVERDGTTEWAPTASGEFYEPPDDDGQSELPATPAALVATAIDRIAALENVLRDLPPQPAQLGHNQPPDAVGTPPYTEEDAAEATDVIAESRAALAAPSPDTAQLTALADRFQRLGSKFGPWLAKKGDLAVDELIKNSVRVVTWTKAFAAFAAVAEVLVQLAKQLH